MLSNMELERLTSEQLAAKAKEHLLSIDSNVQKNIKVLCSKENIMTLLQAGADVVYLNIKGKTCYMHEITYDKHRFIATSVSRIEY